MSAAGAAATAAPRQVLHGVLLLDKDVGMTSTQALGKARRLLGATKAGHTGTLDPLASGLLPLAFGAATKFAQASLEADKAYRATIALGMTREGGDLEGDVLRERPVHCTREDVVRVLAAHVGAIAQVPPMRSALKHEGRPLYEYAWQGIEIERPARDVTIHRIDLVDCCLPQLVVDIACSKGTYIRSLAESIGEALGCGAHLAALRRIASGRCRIDGAMTLEGLQALDPDARVARLLAPDVLVGDCPLVRLAAPEAARFLTGLRRRVRLPDSEMVRVYGPEPTAFLGTAHVRAGELISQRLLSPEEVRWLVERAPAG